MRAPARRRARVRHGDAARRPRPRPLGLPPLDELPLGRRARHRPAVEGDEEKTAALEAFTEKLVPGRWDDVRWPTRQELKGTKVLALPIDEASAKVRTGGPVDDAEDYASTPGPASSRSASPPDAPIPDSDGPVPDHVQTLHCAPMRRPGDGPRAGWPPRAAGRRPPQAAAPTPRRRSTSRRPPSRVPTPGAAAPAGRYLTAALTKPHARLHAPPGGARPHAASAEDRVRLGARSSACSRRRGAVAEGRRRPAAQRPPRLDPRRRDASWPAPTTTSASTARTAPAALRDDGRTVVRFPVAVGRPGNETPLGRFAVTDKLDADRRHLALRLLRARAHRPPDQARAGLAGRRPPRHPRHARHLDDRPGRLARLHARAREGAAQAHAPRPPRRAGGRPGVTLAETIDPGWARALAPVEGQLAELGRFLREETRRGPRLPAGRAAHPARVPARRSPTSGS